jgi:hypothetical protein
MRAAIMLVCLASLALGLSRSSIAASRPATDSHAGLTVTLPAGWHVVQKRLTPCTNPLERLTLSGHGALVTLMETLDPRSHLRHFSPRPRRFALHGEPQWSACCAPLNRRGWFLNFRDHGRGFYAYVYLGRPGTREETLGILDTVRVQPRSQ